MNRIKEKKNQESEVGSQKSGVRIKVCSLGMKKIKESRDRSQVTGYRNRKLGVGIKDKKPCAEIKLDKRQTKH